MGRWQQQITFIYVSNLANSHRFYAENLGFELLVDQGDCRIYQTSSHGYLGLCERPEQVDARISERIRGELRFLDGESYCGLFALSKAHRKTLAAEDRVLSRERGTFALMHSQGLCVAGGSGNGAK